jgi:hypothetical protein
VLCHQTLHHHLLLLLLLLAAAPPSWTLHPWCAGLVRQRVQQSSLPL